MGFMFFIPPEHSGYGAYGSAAARYARHVSDSIDAGEEPMPREEWDKKEAEKKQPPQEPPYSDHMR